MSECPTPASGVGHAVGRYEGAWSVPKESQPHEVLVRALLALEDRARDHLSAQGRRYSRAGTVRTVRHRYNIDLGKKISSWLNEDPARRDVPNDPNEVWALVQVWSEMAGIKDV